ncbi:TonB-dependent receptor plug domain-containing protein [Altericroceibacterium spongiae]|nr:TonB-dependent receptor [Altericroceibacterium spongiae]
MISWKIAFRAALAAGCCSLPILAQAQTDSSAEDEDSLGARINIALPDPAAELDRSGLEKQQARTSDTAQLLTRIPGVSGATGGGISTMPAIRGLGEQRLTILVDGQTIDAACPNDMNSPLSYTDPQTLSSVNVLTGVAPVSSGGDNIGGIISVESAPPLFSVSDSLLVTGSVSTFYRSNGDGFGGAVKLTAAGRKLSASYTGSYTRSEQYEGGGSDELVRSTEYAKTDHALELAYQAGAGLFRLKAGYHFSPYEGFPNQYMDMTSNKSWFLNGSYRGIYDWGDLDLAIAYRDTDHAMNFLEDKLPGDMPMNTEVHSFNTSAKTSLPVSSRDTLRLGGEFHHQWLNDYWPPVEGSMMMGPDVFLNINEATRDRISLYSEWEAQWSDRLKTIAGIRYEHLRMNTGDVQPYGTGMMNMADAMAADAFNSVGHKRHDNNWNASILLTYAMNDWAVLELGYAHKTRSPNIYERYTWGRGSMASRMIGWYGDGNGYVGNLDLKPERADTVSAALALGNDTSGWHLRIAPYYTHVDDYIDTIFLQDLTDMMGMPTGFVQLQFANQEAEFYGTDLSGSVDLWTGKAQEKTSITASASWLRANNLSDDGPVYRQMPLHALLGLTHKQGALELGAELEWVDAKTRLDATRHEMKTGDYALMNLTAAYTIAGIRLSVEATNLFDKAYDLPMGGVSLGDYGVTGNLRNIPGRGRSINLGLSTNF